MRRRGRRLAPERPRPRRRNLDNIPPNLPVPPARPAPLCAMARLSATLACCLLFAGCVTGSAPVNSNAIKNLAGAAGSAHPVSESPGEPAPDGETQNFAIDAVQPQHCAADGECSGEEYCFRGACLHCKKRRKRCVRDAVCCPGNHCSNGFCQPNDADLLQQPGAEEAAGSTSEGNSTAAPQVKAQPRDPPQAIKGLEGENCLRSSDCAEGLCCARHFWSKICKPVLKEGQVCTKHKRKGTHGLEIFQRCDCGAGLSCRTQSGEHSGKSSRSLHTCQRH
ncbi:dickkopf-related protein 1b [Denticeps clupeoides]|uniref:Dickkopf N-terminal cysteine-rich domain-containing protein n=1 Tax=Denticeps clupeoides TaxID=299321 RepID=A0AAY4D226_9TELE|nr:dickkopf-related protein 1 [Denticeps clupeoides]